MRSAAPSPPPFYQTYSYNFSAYIMVKSPIFTVAGHVDVLNKCFLTSFYVICPTQCVYVNLSFQCFDSEIRKMAEKMAAIFDKLSTWFNWLTQHKKKHTALSFFGQNIYYIYTCTWWKWSQLQDFLLYVSLKSMNSTKIVNDVNIDCFCFCYCIITRILDIFYKSALRCPNTWGCRVIAIGLNNNV